MNKFPAMPSGGCLRPPADLRADGSGSVMLEFVIAFPLVLVMAFACIQFSQIWIARMVVHYGAYCAARSALVCKDGSSSAAPGNAAQQIAASLQQTWSAGSGDRSSIQLNASPQWNVTATHTYTFSLITPIIGQIIAWNMNPWDDKSPWSTSISGNQDSLGYPTIQLTEVVTLPKPYMTMVDPGF
jgi:Flp pilus assembly protein TadG